MPDCNKSQKQSRENTQLGNNEKMKRKCNERKWKPNGRETKKKYGSKKIES